MMKRKMNNILVFLVTLVLFGTSMEIVAQERLQPMQDINAFKKGMKEASAGTSSIGSDFEQLKGSELIR